MYGVLVFIWLFSASYLLKVSIKKHKNVKFFLRIKWHTPIRGEREKKANPKTHRNLDSKTSERNKIIYNRIDFYSRFHSIQATMHTYRSVRSRARADFYIILYIIDLMLCSVYFFLSDFYTLFLSFGFILFEFQWHTFKLSSPEYFHLFGFEWRRWRW